MVKLKRLKINKYRNVRPGTELGFDDGFNLVLGQNGSGKTTLLGLIAMACGWSFAELEDEDFSIEFTSETDSNRFTFSLINERNIETALLDYSFTLTIGQAEPFLTCHGTSSTVAVLTNNVLRHHAAYSPFRSDFLQQLTHIIVSSASFGVGLSLGMLRLDAAPYRFDESLSCFHALTGQTAVAAPPAVPLSFTTTAMVNFASASPDIKFNAKNHPVRFSEHFVRHLFATQHELTTSFSVGCEQIPGLSHIAELIGVERIVLRPVISAIGKTAKSRSITIQALDFFIIRKDGSSISHRFLSYGQKRLLAFFCYLYATTYDFVIADELVNGLHHRWIATCVEAIGDRQAFLTSQNPLLFDYVPAFESVEQVQSRFITCITEVIDDAEQLVWQNMPEDHARVFFEAYKDDLEQVGEILIARGLW